MQRLRQAFDQLLAALGWTAAALLALSAVGIGVDVVSRKLGVASLPWMIELVEYALLGVTFLGAPWVLRLSAHVRVDIAVSNLPPAARRYVEAAASLLGAAISASLGYYAFGLAHESYVVGARIFKTFVVPEWWLFAVAGMSMGLMTVQFLRQLGASLSDRGDGGGDRREASF